jgi:peptidoglycan/LPS O-acetylase OafA/YrhL
MGNNIGKGGWIPSLNGWRAIAILLVMMDHAKYTVGFPAASLTSWRWTLFSQGNLGVRIFFVISGFLITYLLLQEAELSGSISLKRFFIRRCLRILPVYLVYLAVLATLLALHLYFGEQTSSWIGALTFTRNMVGPANSFTGHFWSLAVEEQFYLIWPCCLMAFSIWRRPKLGLVFFIILASACILFRVGNITVEANGPLWGRLLGGNSILIYADSLAMGCLGAFLTRKISFQTTATTSSLILLATIVVVVIGAFWNDLFGEANGIIAALIPSVQAAAIMLAIYVSTQPNNAVAFQILNSWPMNWLGILSYSLYIWHVIFLCPFQGTPLRTFLYGWQTWWLAALLVASVSYFCVERPILRFKKNFGSIS